VEKLETGNVNAVEVVPVKTNVTGLEAVTPVEPAPPTSANFAVKVMGETAAVVFCM